ncbi:MltR family transcriptional regulator [Bradyrhizobium sp. TM239]|uniref:MltR family transcriptional regulator n=1 Tax=Bradyrhizobium sp. TM239 TaxID=2599802 RepID=UPI0027D5494D|nr:hypothetical protein TM239_11310 [Bradyrhizobium sp. TM239]
MIWSILSPEDGDEREELDRALHDIDASPDRAAAIVAAAFIERHLELALKARLVQDDTYLKDMFRSSGPLGSFSSKIRMAYLLGICSKETTRDLETIKNIRNAFAHDVLIAGFDNQRINDLTENLENATVNLVIRIVGHDDVPPQMAFPKEASTSRERFIRASQILMFQFVTNKKRHRKPRESLF